MILYYLFDKSIIFYSKSLTLGVILLIIINGFFIYRYDRLLYIWLFINIIIIILAYLLQRPLKKYIANDLDKLYTLAFINQRTLNFNDIVDSIIYTVAGSAIIPNKFKTYTPFTEFILKAIEQAPFYCYIVRTGAYYRFSWMRIIKEDAEYMINNMKIGDIIYYHNNNSLIGLTIRFFTRCYWEHLAPYIGDGYIIDVAPGGVKKIKIADWINNKHVELAILRPKDNLAIEIAEKYKKKLGHTYNYSAVIRIFWDIITCKPGLGLMPLFQVYINIILYLLIFQTIILEPSYIRLYICIIYILTIYTLGCIYHPIAYSRLYKEIVSLETFKREVD